MMICKIKHPEVTPLVFSVCMLGAFKTKYLTMKTWGEKKMK